MKCRYFKNTSQLSGNQKANKYNNKTKKNFHSKIKRKKKEFLKNDGYRKYNIQCIHLEWKDKYEERPRHWQATRNPNKHYNRCRFSIK